MLLGPRVRRRSQLVVPPQNAQAAEDCVRACEVGMEGTPASARQATFAALEGSIVASSWQEGNCCAGLRCCCSQTSKPLTQVFHTDDVDTTGDVIP